MATQAAKYVKLVMVTADNNNKYYEMTHNGGSTFSVKYGRVESTAVDGSYPIGDWDKKYNEKVKKGYVDVTHTVSVKVDTTPTKGAQYAKIAEARVEEFVTKMKAYTDKLVSSTYSVQAKDVTQAQVDEAQGYIDDLVKLSKARKISDTDINATLLKLYTIIPRRMSNVRDYLMPSISLKDILEDEQDNLDAMASQVALATPKKTTSKTSKAVKTLLETIGVTMKEIKAPKEIDYLVKQVTRNKIVAIFEVNKPEEDATFAKWMAKQKDKTTKILIHGTKCTSVVPILEQGLKIRPAGNFQFSGKAYGDGNYYSEVVQKSMGYTGYDKDHVLLVYEVHTGNPFVYNGWYTGNSFSLTYKELQKRGFDSTHVNAGNGLLNSEIIAYNEEQNRIKYIIWLN
jgi:poly [ADP-ribose] polymerase